MSANSANNRNDQVGLAISNNRNYALTGDQSDQKKQDKRSSEGREEEQKENKDLSTRCLTGGIERQKPSSSVCPVRDDQRILMTRLCHHQQKEKKQKRKYKSKQKSLFAVARGHGNLTNSGLLN